MSLFRRKLLGDRLTMIFVLVATAFVVYQWQTRGDRMRLYFLIGWGLFVIWLIAFTELRIGRKQLRRGKDAMFLGLAAFVGEETVGTDGERQKGFTGTAPGALAFEAQGIRWVPREADDGPPEISFGWADVYSWRFGGVIPFIWRASGYLLISLYGGRELVFHIHGVRAWRAAVREAAIVGPTLLARVGEPGIAPPNITASATPELQPEFPVPIDEPEGVAEPAVEYEPVIGLECHVELSTASKMFCSCATSFGAAPNTQICPVCTGQPGTLPVPNRMAIEHMLRIGLSLGSSIEPTSVFHRKNYFYPDMPKNYQISQYEIPMCSGGTLTYEVDGEFKSARIHRVHIEEDTGKTSHAGEGGRIGEGEHALVDYNRAGIPLAEIVSEPDIATPEDARAYLAELRTVLLTLGVSDVRLEEGSLRCDANVSVRPKGSTTLGTKTEVKNMNSLRSVQRALAYEIERQLEMVARGEEIVQETRHFDENTGKTIGGRSKEGSSDYRYFSDPDLVPIAPSNALIEEVRSSLPELPSKRRQRFVTDLGLAPADARTLVSDPGLAAAFEEAVKAYAGPGAPVARWYLGELSQLANEAGKGPHEVGVGPAQVAELQRLVDDGKVSISLAKGDVLRKVVETGQSPGQVVEEGGMAQISDTTELDAVIDEVIAANPEVVAQIEGGKGGAVNALVGQVMKRTGGQANPGVVKDLLAARFPS
jgi:aspartyl-tRNA(Asn)/glutamyl-tRNA(Gln) amidotransferase subunit B